MIQRDQAGFTLIEVIVALVILAMLSLLTAQAIQSAIQNRSFITADIARDAELADAMRIIRNDVSSAFHHRDIFVALENEAIKPKPKSKKKYVDADRNGVDDNTGEKIPTGADVVDADGNPINPPPPTTNPDDENGDPDDAAIAKPSPRPSPPIVTGFIGESGSMYFTTLSNVRTLRDSKESDQAKIGYFTKTCRSRDPSKKDRPDSKCLYRSITPLLDLEIDKPGPETVLLENVQDFKLRYWGPEREEFTETWKTDQNGEADMKDVFPEAVEVTLTIVDSNGEKPRPLTSVALIPLRFPNNAPKKSPTPEGQQQGQQTNPGANEDDDGSGGSN